jgi:hypothetical protein
VEEKNKQVPTMADIYSLANDVLIWLGEERVGSSHVLQWTNNMAIEATSGKKIPAEDNVEFVWLLFGIIFQPWWTRLWTVQEVSLAKRDPILVCGLATASFSSFLAVVGPAFVLGVSHQLEVLEPLM